jgi:hypothetical protein
MWSLFKKSCVVPEPTPCLHRPDPVVNELVLKFVKVFKENHRSFKLIEVSKGYTWFLQDLVTDEKWTFYKKLQQGPTGEKVMVYKLDPVNFITRDDALYLFSEIGGFYEGRLKRLRIIKRVRAKRVYKKEIERLTQVYN